MFEFADSFDSGSGYGTIHNVACPAGGRIVMNPLRPPIDDFDALSFPDHLPQKSYFCHNGRIVTLSGDLFRIYVRSGGRACNSISTRGLLSFGRHPCA